MNTVIFQNVILVRKAPGTSAEEIDLFLKRYENASTIQSGVHTRGQAYIEPSIRNSTCVLVKRMDPIVLAVAQAVRHVNEKYFMCNVADYCRENEMLQYGVEGVFTPHTDIIFPMNTMKINQQPIRKLTSILMLSRRESFTGGVLRLWKGQQSFRFDWDLGDIVVLPSFVKHGVESVHSGVRRTLVSWSHGVY